MRFSRGTERRHDDSASMAVGTLDAEHDRRVTRVALALEPESLEDDEVFWLVDPLARRASHPDVLEMEVGVEPGRLELCHSIGHGVGWLHLDQPMARLESGGGGRPERWARNPTVT